jgi:hypothetical protein
MVVEVACHSRSPCRRVVFQQHRKAVRSLRLRWKWMEGTKARRRKQQGEVVGNWEWKWMALVV